MFHQAAVLMSRSPGASPSGCMPGKAAEDEARKRTSQAVVLFSRSPRRCRARPTPKGLLKNNFRFWRERRLARCEARGASARAPGASPPVGCDRRATKQMARRRPAPEGWGCLAVWRCCSLLTDRWRVCASLAPSQTAKQPPAKSEFIFEQTLSFRAECRRPVSPIIRFKRPDGYWR